MSSMYYSMKAVARRTGLTAHVIRVWEKRYEAVKPARTGTNRRLYSDNEIERLGLLKRATLAGHSIGNIANLPNEKLLELAADNGAQVSAPRLESAKHFVDACVAAIRQMDTRLFEETLSQAMLKLGQHGLLEKVVGPLAQTIGEMWRDGSIMAAHEHFASAVIRTFLGRHSRPFAGGGEMPVLVVATPSGQLHELGAVMASAAASDLGWRTIYLGTSLPAAEIAAAAIQNGARAVALSLVYPEDDNHLPAELESLRGFLPSTIKIIVGGRAAVAYQTALDKIGAARLTDMRSFYAQLEALRSPGEVTTK
jgi:DNA-binding transcriptional MerR regulator/methylmalonyl-CoA mutase cobalamin-binding subunit